MSTLTASELESLREVAEGTLPDTCTIQTVTNTNNKGSVSQTWANTYKNVACRLAGGGKNSDEREVANRVGFTPSLMLTIPYDQAIDTANRVVHGGVTYEVTGIDNETAGWRTVRRVNLKRVQ